MDIKHGTTIDSIMEYLIENGGDGMARVFGQLLELVMQIVSRAAQNWASRAA